MMNLRITKPGTEDLVEKYVGKKFRYISKYGGYTDNILCEDISVCEIMNHKNGGLVMEKIEISIISDKRNVYDLNEVEFYEKVD
jgi:hypothetical protein